MHSDVYVRSTEACCVMKRTEKNMPTRSFDWRKSYKTLGVMLDMHVRHTASLDTENEPQKVKVVISGKYKNLNKITKI